MTTNEIEKYAKSLLQEVQYLQLSNEEGDTQEQAFTRLVLEMLAEAGDTENTDVAPYEKDLGTRNQQKISGYAIADNYETVDLFISLFAPEEGFRLYKEDVDRAATRIANFFRKCIYGDYVKDMAESAAIFEFAHTLASYQELKDNLVRVNAFILTNGEYPGVVPKDTSICGYKFFYRVVDIRYLYQISHSTQVPVEIDFEEGGYKVPCVSSDTHTPDYQTYLAIIPGECLADLYERFGSRLLEQNVRSFLQFTGKVNKGIRKTIMEEPHMFLAFNNGIAATVDFIELDADGRYIKKVSNLQIVNGGQTTASIYYTQKKDKADLSEISVQVKFSVIHKKENYENIVSRISQYSNTQNKVKNADFSATNPYLIEFERLSRRIAAPNTIHSSVPTYWFFERTRGQYATTMKKEGFTKTRKNAFQLKNPKEQVITKQQLAKYCNAYCEIYGGRKQLLIAPHIVAKGDENNFAMFISHNLPDSPQRMDNVYFEDVVAKAILFRTADKLHGTKKSIRCIGDLKSIVVPYSIGILRHLTKDRINLYKIWKNQALSPEMSDLLYNLMVEVNRFFIENSPQSYFSEWAKKEECWLLAKEYNWQCDIRDISADLINPNSPPRRNVVNTSPKEMEAEKVANEEAIIRAIPYSLWDRIAEWGQASDCLTIQQQANARELAYICKFNKKLNDLNRSRGITLYEIVCEKNIELLEEADTYASEKTESAEQPHDLQTEAQQNNAIRSGRDVTMEVLRKMVNWEKEHHALEEWKLRIMIEVLERRRSLYKYQRGFYLNYLKMVDAGFEG